MTCASCVSHVEKALKGITGVTGATVNLGLGLARVEYISGVVFTRQMTQAVEAAGYGAMVQASRTEAIDREREAREREVKRQGRYLLFVAPIAVLLMIGTFRDMWIFPQFVPAWLGYKWVLGLLATPVVFGPGRQFFVNSWRGLRHGGRHLPPET